MKTIHKTIDEYNNSQPKNIKEICNLLKDTIDTNLKKSESKVWYGSPVWFLDGNPVVLYYVKKNGQVSLMFFSGQSFDEKDLKSEGKFKAAEIFYTDTKEIKITNVKRWLKKAKTIQWDYKNIAKRKGVLEMIDLSKSNTPKKVLKTSSSHDERMASMIFGIVYPMYITKIEKKGRTKEELNEVIKWLTGFDNKKIRELIKEKITFETFFEKAKLNPKANLITGVICGYRIEDIKNPLTQKVRYLDKLVDELAKGKSLEKILRK